MLLKVVAIVDGDDPRTRQLLDHIAVEQHQIEVNDRFDRDVSEDVEAGASVLGPAGEVEWRRASR
jgi:ornithine decarboxylase